MKNKILDCVTQSFIESSDFNGISLSELSLKVGIEYIKLIEYCEEMLMDGDILLQDSVNPHIVHTKLYNIEEQLRFLENAKQNKKTYHKAISNIQLVSESHIVCVYPTSKNLILLDNAKYENKPYSKQLYLVSPQIRPLYFELDVLDRYVKDPRYSFSFNNYSGSISYNDIGEDELQEKDKIFLKTFGLGFDEKSDRVIVTYPRYLSNLSAEHQLYWKSKEIISPNCKPLYEYWQNTIGAWTNSYSVYTAFIGEQNSVNTLSEKIFGIPLFKKTFEDHKRPKEFTFYFSPTLKNYNDFVMLLDKMISDNINKDFFKKQGCSLSEEISMENGTIKKVDKGTLRLLEEWLYSNFIPNNTNALDGFFDPFKNVRKERQNPAHRITIDVFDKSYFDKQNILIKEAYYTMRNLRYALQQHEKSENVTIPSWLNEGEVKIF